MGIEGKLEAELELKSTVDKLYKRLKSEIHHAPDASSDKIHAIEVHEGDWETPGSVKLWTYTIELHIMDLSGKLETAMEIPASAENFLKLFRTQVYHLPNISLDFIQSIELHEGKWHAYGALKLWSYTLGMV
ncbi:hypothetical protein CDL15_Pgr006373 [Punica granatum]|uniref:Bet v I/Major latex protein domain-containing protein n=1 Tax=Punica granatum TaxID=22663 RepID=A0A218VUJ8_PUNGR|nr:hypothetical protein CDL15_Pgr006373 [Punica granatum]